MAKYKQYILDKHLPHSISGKHHFHASNVAYGYHTYKAKCLGHGGLTCKKSHAHEREIVSDCCNPIKRQLRICAKAVRLAKLLSRELSWTLWNQPQLKHELFNRHAKLATVNRYVDFCVCGKATNALSMIKADAAQFFKAASISRGVDRVKQQLNRIANSSGLTAIAVAKNKSCDGFLCKPIRKSNIHFEVITFERINSILPFWKMITTS